MVLLEFSMFPTDKGESKSAYVSQILNLIDESGLAYQLTPMGTIIEGEWEEVMALVSRCFNHLKPQANRIFSTIKIDWRNTSDSRMKSKIAKIESLLDKEINH